MSLRFATVSCHALLVAALAASIAFPALSTLRATLLVLVVTPLLLVLPGITRGERRLEARLAVLLVPYVGGLSMEVVARSGAAWLVNVALLAAVLELGLLLALIRQRARSPVARE